MLGLKEDMRPLLKSSEIVAHAFASTEGGGELSCEFLSESSSLDHVASLEVGEKSLNIGDSGLTVLDAKDDLIQVAVDNKTIEHTSSE